MCKGKKCTSPPGTKGPLLHVTKASDLKDATITTIVDHFYECNVGYLNAFYFQNLPIAKTSPVKGLLGDSKNWGQTYSERAQSM